MERPVPGIGEVCDGLPVGELEGGGVHVGVAGVGPDVLGDPTGSVEMAGGDGDVGASAGERTCGLHADAGRGAGDYGALAGQVDALADFLRGVVPGERGGDERGHDSPSCRRVLYRAARALPRRRNESVAGAPYPGSTPQTQAVVT